MNTKKTATEVLINIEGDVKYLKAAVKSLDFKISLLLNALNGNQSVYPPKAQASAPAPVSPAVKEDFTQVKLGDEPHSSKQHIAATPINGFQPEQDSDGNIEMQVETIPKGVRRTSNRGPNPLTASDPAQRVQVQQKITYPDGDKVALATVHILSGTGELIKTTRTNSFGKWVAALSPGIYKIKVKKPSMKDKVSVEGEYSVTIPSSATPVELEPPSF